MKRSRAYKAIEYCRRDTEITGKFVETMLAKYREIGCVPKTTIAATTLNYFESKFYGRKVTHSFKESDIDFFHEGYYGGRTEIFYNRPIEGKIFYHDVNALYAHCLKTQPYPDLKFHYRTRTPDFQKDGVAKITVKTPNLQIPYLPARHKKKLLFPIGTFTGVYTYFEIREALKLGYKILKIHRAHEFPCQVFPFVRFIETITAQRDHAQQTGDGLMSMVWKAFGNHAYGKYGQKNETTEIIPVSHLKNIPSGTIILGENLALIKKKIKYPKHANCIWAMYTTAYARHYLYTHLTRIPPTAVLLYCDTDSIIYENSTQILPNSKKLGEFKTEHCKDCRKPYRYAHFKLPKLYALKCRCRTVYKAKGVPSAQAENYLLYNKATYKKPNKLRETLRRNLSPKRTHKLIPNFWETREKEITGIYTKRTVLNNGFTKPVELTKKGKINEISIHAREKDDRRHRIDPRARNRPGKNRGAPEANRHRRKSDSL